MFYFVFMSRANGKEILTNPVTERCIGFARIPSVKTKTELIKARYDTSRLKGSV